MIDRAARIGIGGPMLAPALEEPAFSKTA